MKHFWIINDYDSTTIFYRNYSDIQLDSDLISGLLSALNNFSEMEMGQHGIESINMSGLTWVYHDDSELDLLFIGADEKGISSSVLKSRLEVIRNAFKQEYSLTTNTFKESNGNVQRFQTFKETTDMLLQQWSEAEKVIDKAVMFDLLGVFQQVFNLFVNIINLNFFGETYQKIVGEIQEILANTVNSDDYSILPEIQNISFEEKSGWNIFTMDPSQLTDFGVLEKLLLSLTNDIRSLISSKLGKMVSLNAFTYEVFPFLLSNWNLLKKLNIDRKIMSIFLTK